MCIEEELEELRESVAELEARTGTVSPDEWRRIEARAFLAVLGGQLQLTSLQKMMIAQVRAKARDCTWRRTHLEVGRLVDKLGELRTLKTRAQCRAIELESKTEIEATDAFALGT